MQKLGAQHVQLDQLSRAGLNPLSELKALTEITQHLQDYRPDVLFSYFLKPVIWGAIAARRAGVPRSVGMIEGMGHAFSHHPGSSSLSRAKNLMLRATLNTLLARSLPLLDAVITLNPHDHQRLSQLSPNVQQIDGIGIDLLNWFPTPTPDGPVHFLMAARLLREKGVADFAEAARALHRSARFTLLGGVDTARGALPRAQAQAWADKGWLTWHGHVRDVAAHLRQASVFVLPTRYAEGLPRSTMEAMAMGRPVITTSMPGARHAVTDEHSGLIVPPGDTPALIAACQSLIHDPSRIRAMGRAARQEAQRRFDLAARNSEQIAIITKYITRTS